MAKVDPKSSGEMKWVEREGASKRAMVYGERNVRGQRVKKESRCGDAAIKTPPPH